MYSQGGKPQFRLIKFHHLVLGQMPEEILGSAGHKESRWTRGWVSHQLWLSQPVSLARLKRYEIQDRTMLMERTGKLREEKPEIMTGACLHGRVSHRERGCGPGIYPKVLQDCTHHTTSCVAPSPRGPMLTTVFFSPASMVPKQYCKEVDGLWGREGRAMGTAALGEYF